LLGLAEALKAIHELDIRHGDIKPNNILQFISPQDWRLGSRQTQSDPMILRLKKGQPTDTRFGTTAYAPPEAELLDVRYLSCQYEIWSMGCVILEIIIWLVYGYVGVNNFWLDLQGPHRESVPFYIIEEVVASKAEARAKLQ
ncbi:hypothetical protein B0T24DRAFT_533946, partial [Lasiosphaeria ovina]